MLEEEEGGGRKRTGMFDRAAYLGFMQALMRFQTHIASNRTTPDADSYIRGTYQVKTHCVM
jgi:hypothetical protein